MKFDYSKQLSTGNKNFLVSYLVPVYNKQAFLAKTIKSLLEQKDYNNTPFPVQIILYNDGSKDNSENIIRFCKNMAPNNVTVIENKDGSNNGVGYSFNKCMEYVESEIMIPFGADDTALTYHAFEVYSFMKQFPEVDICYGSFRNIDIYGRVIEDKIAKKFDDYKHLWDLDKLTVYGMFVPHGGLGIRTKTLEKVHYNTERVAGADFEYLLDLYYNGYKFRDIPPRYNSEGKMSNFQFLYLLHPEMISVRKRSAIKLEDQMYINKLKNKYKIKENNV